MMTRKVWLRDDIIMILTGLSSAASHNRDSRFRAGYEAAIQDIALSFEVLVVRGDSELLAMGEGDGSRESKKL